MNVYLKLTVNLRRRLVCKRCSAPALIRTYLKLYIKSNLLELAIKLYQK